MKLNLPGFGSSIKGTPLEKVHKVSDPIGLDPIPDDPERAPRKTSTPPGKKPDTTREREEAAMKANRAQARKSAMIQEEEELG